MTAEAAGHVTASRTHHGIRFWLTLDEQLICWDKQDGRFAAACRISDNPHNDNGALKS